MMLGKMLLVAVTATAGFLMSAEKADARVGVWVGGNGGVAVRTGGYRGGYYGGYRGYGYGYPAYSYGYSYPAYSYPSYGYSYAAYPAYGYSSYGYGYPAYGYGYGGYRGYRGGRTFASGPNGYYYRGPFVGVAGRR